MEAYEQKLHINDDAFEKMREDADIVLQRLIKNMVEKDSMEGKVTITIDVSFMQEFIPNNDPRIEGETRRILKPKIAHKVGSVMQIKSEEKGSKNYEGMELVWDEEQKEYVLKPIANTDQMTIFDADFKCVNDPEEDEDIEEDQPALEGRLVAALPGPSDEDMVEAEIVDDEMEEDLSGEFTGMPLPFTEDDDEDYDYEDPEEY